MEKKLGIYKDEQGNEITIYNDTKTYSDGRDCYKIQGKTFRTAYSDKLYNAMLKDGYKKVM